MEDGLSPTAWNHKKTQATKNESWEPFWSGVTFYWPCGSDVQECDGRSFSSSPSKEREGLCVTQGEQSLALQYLMQGPRTPFRKIDVASPVNTSCAKKKLYFINTFSNRYRHYIKERNAKIKGVFLVLKSYETSASEAREGFEKCTENLCWVSF